VFVSCGHIGQARVTVLAKKGFPKWENPQAELRSLADTALANRI
jgi:hypothetical protein